MIASVPGQFFSKDTEGEKIRPGIYCIGDSACANLLSRIYDGRTLNCSSEQLFIIAQLLLLNVLTLSQGCEFWSARP